MKVENSTPIMEEDERREAAIASTPSLQSNFKPVGVTQDQLSKFQELHRRRLQIKSRSKIQKKLEGTADVTGKTHGKDLITKHCKDEILSIPTEGSSVSTSKSNILNDNSALQQDNTTAHLALKKHQKLHWGLDTKERWERKANM